MNYFKYLFGVILCLCFFACIPSDEERLLGKWQCEQDWFLFYADSTYDGGKAMIPMLKKARYTLNSTDRSLTLYTNQANSTFYLDYTFRGNDTLLLHNKMNSANQQAVYIRQTASVNP